LLREVQAVLAWHTDDVIYDTRGLRKPLTAGEIKRLVSHKVEAGSKNFAAEIAVVLEPYEIKIKELRRKIKELEAKSDDH
jgi:hypothetical protein